jgi:hypothetical protein
MFSLIKRKGSYDERVKLMIETHSTGNTPFLSPARPPPHAPERAPADARPAWSPSPGIRRRTTHGLQTEIPSTRSKSRSLLAISLI